MTIQSTDAAKAAPEGTTASATNSITEAKVVDYTTEDDGGVENTASESHADTSTDKTDGDQKPRDPWPRSAQDFAKRKKAQIEKRDAELAAFRKREEEYKAEIAKYKPKEAAIDPNDPEPALANYSDWGKYNRDLTQWNMRQLQKSEQQAKAQPQTSGDDFSQEEMGWVQQRIPQIAQRKAQILKDNPEYAEVLNPHTEEAIDDLPKAIKMEILKCQDPVLAVIGAVQEGILDDLADMSPALAGKYLKAAVARLQGKDASLAGQAETQQTQAPAPISRPKAQSKSQQSPLEMSDDEFRKKFLNRR